MRIKTHHNKRTEKRWIGMLLLSVFAFFGVAFLVVQSHSSENEYFCDMETPSGDGLHFVSQGHSFFNGNTQSSEKALSGRYASACSEKSLYGAGMEFFNVNAGDVFEAGIWRQADDGYGVLAFQGDWNFYEQATVSERTQNGWDYISKKIVVPIGVKNGTLKIFPYNSQKEGTVYFDDLTIQRSSAQQNKTFTPQASEFEYTTLQLQIEDKELKRLKAKRLEAFAKGNLITGRSDLVPAKLIVNDSTINVTTRLKGDLLDHLKGHKWSFRIVADEMEAWNGMHEFSIHNSLSRAHLDEWIFHQLLKHEGILTTRYDFVVAQLNDTPLGIYAYEEHFNFALLDHAKQLRGPILRISEDALWKYASEGLKEQPPWLESAQISSFEEKEILKDDDYLLQYETAQNLLYAFRNGKKKVAEVFDIDQMAKFMAIQDLCLSDHAFNFTNLRFYFNAQKGRLQPIGYDGYSDQGTRWHQAPLLTGANVNSRVDLKVSQAQRMRDFHHLFFEDENFVRQYVFYLEQFIQDDYINEFIEPHINAIEQRAQFIRQEYTNYEFDWQYYFRNAKEIRKVLYPMEELSIKAYQWNKDSILIESYHQLPIAIKAIGTKQDQYPLQKSTVLESYSKYVPVRRYKIPSRGKPTHLYCQTIGTDSLVRFPIFKWNAPVSIPSNINASIDRLKSFNFIQINEKSKRITIKSGQHTLRQSLLIPKNWQVEIAAGAALNLTNQAAIISQSPIQANGRSDQPIKIYSSDESGQGLMIYGCSQNSSFTNTIFSHLAAIQQNGQFSDGGVNLYQTKALFTRCFFVNSVAKDALHINDSTFELNDCVFQSNAGDALDANFSDGKIYSSILSKTGGDALEINGGKLRIQNVSIDSTRQSALLAGHRAFVQVDQLKVSHSQKGVTAKDQALIQGKTIEMNKVEQGYIAFQQAASFGGGTIEVQQHKGNDIPLLHVIEDRSTLVLNGEKITTN